MGAYILPESRLQGGSVPGSGEQSSPAHTGWVESSLSCFLRAAFEW